MHSTFLLSPCEHLAINSLRVWLKQNFETLSQKSPFHKMLFNLTPLTSGLHWYDPWIFFCVFTGRILYVISHMYGFSHLHLQSNDSPMFPKYHFSIMSRHSSLALTNQYAQIHSSFFAAEIIFLAQEFMVSFFEAPWSRSRARPHWCGSPKRSMLAVCIRTLWNKHYYVIPMLNIVLRCNKYKGALNYGMFWFAVAFPVFHDSLFQQNSWVLFKILIYHNYKEKWEQQCQLDAQTAYNAHPWSAICPLPPTVIVF